jgi:hypothetical protein
LNQAKDGGRYGFSQRRYVIARLPDLDWHDRAITADLLCGCGGPNGEIVDKGA